MFRHLGLSLSVLRSLRGKSQSQVAREAGIGKSQLSKYENGKELPKLESLAKILGALQVTPLGFFWAQDLLGRQEGALRKESYGVPVSQDLSVLSPRTERLVSRLFENLLALNESLILEKLAPAAQREPPR